MTTEATETDGWPKRAKRRPEDRFWALVRNGLRLKCPVCKNARICPSLMKMAKDCPGCGIQLEREAGYFLGSIYFNYGATCGLALASYVISYFACNASENVAVGLAVGITLVFPFWFWRYARSAWLVMDQYFDPRTPPTAKAAAAGLGTRT